MRWASFWDVVITSIRSSRRSIVLIRRSGCVRAARDATFGDPAANHCFVGEGICPADEDTPEARLLRRLDAGGAAPPGGAEERASDLPVTPPKAVSEDGAAVLTDRRLGQVTRGRFDRASLLRPRKPRAEAPDEPLAFAFG
jgi:hypothetical protein